MAPPWVQRWSTGSGFNSVSASHAPAMREIQEGTCPSLSQWDQTRLPGRAGQRPSHSLLLGGRWKEAGLRTSDSYLAMTRGGHSENGVNTQEWGRMRREKPDPDDIIWATELTPDLSLDRSVMRTNKLLFDLIQSVLGLGSFLRSEES